MYTPLSSQELVNSTHEKVPAKKLCPVDSFGCRKAELWHLLEYAKKHGLHSAEDIPYVCVKMDCIRIKNKMKTLLESYEILTPPFNEDKINVLIKEHSIIDSFTVWQNFSSYTEGVYVGPKVGSDNVVSSVHAMMIIGYGEENWQKFFLVKTLLVTYGAMTGSERLLVGWLRR